MVRDEQSTQGVLELHPKGFGFLRNAARNYVAQQADPYVPAPLIQQLGLREGLLLDRPAGVGPGNGRASPADRGWPASSKSRASRPSSSGGATSTTSPPSTRTSTSGSKPAASR